MNIQRGNNLKSLDILVYNKKKKWPFMSILNLLLALVYPIIRKLFTWLQFCMSEKQNQKVKKEESKGRTVCKSM